MPSSQTTDTKCSHDPLDHCKLKRFMFFVQSQHQHSQNNDLDSYSEHNNTWSYFLIQIHFYLLPILNCRPSPLNLYLVFQIEVQ